MKKCNTLKFGITGGVALGIFHLCWVVLIGLGVAQSLLDWIFKLHMIKPVYVIMPFSWGSAVGLLILTMVVGFVGGLVVGSIWSLCKEKK